VALKDPALHTTSKASRGAGHRRRRPSWPYFAPLGQAVQGGAWRRRNGSEVPGARRVTACFRRPDERQGHPSFCNVRRCAASRTLVRATVCAGLVAGWSHHQPISFPAGGLRLCVRAFLWGQLLSWNRLLDVVVDTFESQLVLHSGLCRLCWSGLFPVVQCLRSASHEGAFAAPARRGNALRGGGRAGCRGVACAMCR